MKTIRITLRLPEILHQKVKYTAVYNSRSKNKEIETAIKRYINDFERLYGVIDTEKVSDE